MGYGRLWWNRSFGIKIYIKLYINYEKFCTLWRYFSHTLFLYIVKDPFVRRKYLYNLFKNDKDLAGWQEQKYNGATATIILCGTNLFYIQKNIKNSLNKNAIKWLLTKENFK